MAGFSTAFFLATAFLAGAFLADAFFEAVFLVGAFLATFLTVFLAGGSLVPGAAAFLDTLRVVTFFSGAFLAAAFLVAFLGAIFFSGAFLAAAFLVAFLVVTFFAGTFLPPFLAGFFTAFLAAVFFELVFFFAVPMGLLFTKIYNPPIIGGKRGIKQQQPPARQCQTEKLSQVPKTAGIRGEAGSCRPLSRRRARWSAATPRACPRPAPRPCRPGKSESRWFSHRAPPRTAGQPRRRRP